MENVKLPKWYGFSSKNIKNIELHVFTDASSCSYGTVAYFHFIQGLNIKWVFIPWKSKAKYATFRATSSSNSNTTQNNYRKEKTHFY